MIKYFFKILFFILSPLPVMAQADYADGLKQELVNEKEDSNKVNTLNRLTWAMIQAGNYPDARKYANEALALAEKIKFESGLADALNETAAILIYDYKQEGNFNAALDSSLKALKIYRDRRDSAAWIKCMYVAAIASHNMGQIARSLKWLDTIASYYLRRHDTTTAMYSVMMMGHSYFDLGDYEHAYEWGIKAEKMAVRFSDSVGQAYALAHLANLYNNAELPQLALPYVHKILAIYPYQSIQTGKALPDLSFPLIWPLITCGDTYMKINEPDSAEWVNSSIPDDELDNWILYYYGRFYAAKDDYAKSLAYFKSAYRQSLKLGLTIGVARREYGIANNYFHLGQIDSARKYALLALQRAEPVYARLEKKKTAGLLMDIYAVDKNFAQAYYYSRLFISLADSVASEQSNRKLFLMQVEEQLDKQKQQSLLLEQDNKIKEQRLSRSTILRNSLVGLALLLLCIAVILVRSSRQRIKANRLLKEQKEKVEHALEELKSTQAQLIQSEKMASLGELTAGIAHEIQNPLNFVNNFSEVSTELVDEMKEELSKSNYEDANAIADDLKQNLEKINHHGKRAGDIVKGMLQHSKTSSGQKEPTDINALCDEYLRLAYHGLRAKDKSFNAVPIAIGMKTDFDETLPKINVVPQDIGRVILNLINNAFYAVSERLRQVQPDMHYEPTVSVTTKKSDNKVIITVSDNGNGIPKDIVDKIFQPFFTTKPTGSGTGLGLSLSYDIVKTHGGEIKVEMADNEGTELSIMLPIANF